MSYADPTAIDDAAKDGATFSEGFIVYGGGPKYLQLTGGVWSLDAASGVLLKSKKTLQLIATGTVLTDPGQVGENGEYRFAIDTVAGRRQLAIDEDGDAALLDP